MPETAVLLEPGFSTADAEYPDFALQGNTLFLDFVGWHGQHVRDALMMSLASAGTNADQVARSPATTASTKSLTLSGSRGCATQEAASPPRDTATSSSSSMRKVRLKSSPRTCALR